MTIELCIGHTSRSLKTRLESGQLFLGNIAGMQDDVTRLIPIMLLAVLQILIQFPDIATQKSTPTYAICQQNANIKVLKKGGFSFILLSLPYIT